MKTQDVSKIPEKDADTPPCGCIYGFVSHGTYEGLPCWFCPDDDKASRIGVSSMSRIRD